MAGSLSQPRRARRRLPAWLLVLVAWLSALPASAETPLVIVLSWDGTRHDYPERAPTPALDRMQREGWRAGRLVPVFPSNTFPGHVSLATGAEPDVHGIVNNRFSDAERGTYDYSADASWIEAEPVWIAAERQGLRAAAVFWVGSESDWRGRRATFRTPFDATVREAEKVDQILGWIDLPEGERPSLILSWWRGCDAAGHRRGPDDPGIVEELTVQDAELGRLIDGLDRRQAWGSTTLILVSDHGMAEVTDWLDPVSALQAVGVEAEASYGGGMAYLYLDPEERARALEALNALPQVQAFPTDQAPPAWRVGAAGRTGAIVAVTEPPFAFRTRPPSLPPSGEPWPAGEPRGGHGYPPDPSTPAGRSMAAIFYAMGRGIPAGAGPAEVRAIDVAPTITRLLGIDPPMNATGVTLPVLRPAGAHTEKPPLAGPGGSVEPPVTAGPTQP